jgi:hypothetical protein
MDFNKIGLAVDAKVHALTSAPEATTSSDAISFYGRGLEQASGMGFWFISFTMLVGGGYGFSAETLAVNNFLWAWMAFTLGACQIYYNGTLQRRVFNLMATAAWVTISISAYQELGGWNFITAVALPYCLCSFYVYGFLLGALAEGPENDS